MIVKSLCRQIVVSGIAITVIAGVSSLQANDKLQLEIVTIKGSSELPKVLYIVPWKRLKNSDFDQKLVLHSLFQDVFDPLEPEAFERRMKNYEQLVKER